MVSHLGRGLGHYVKKGAKRKKAKKGMDLDKYGFVWINMDSYGLVWIFELLYGY